jgi:hypothetical protein
MLKKPFLLLILILAFSSMSGQKNTYRLAEKININYISLIKLKSSVHSNGELIELDFLRENDSVSYVTKIYDTDSEGERLNKTPVKIKTTAFDKLVQKLNQLDIEKPELDLNIADGIVYSLTFGDPKYSISLSANTVSEKERNTKFENFLDSFYFIWEQFEK